MAGYGMKKPTAKPSTPGGSASKGTFPRSKAAKTVTRLVKKSGGTKGEARGVVGNLRHGNTLSPKAQIKRSVRIAKDEGLSRARVQKLKSAERQIVRTATKRQAAKAGVGGAPRAQKPSKPGTLPAVRGRGFKPTK